MGFNVDPTTRRAAFDADVGPQGRPVATAIRSDRRQPLSADGAPAVQPDGQPLAPASAALAPQPAAAPVAETGLSGVVATDQVESAQNAALRAQVEAQRKQIHDQSIQLKALKTQIHDGDEIDHTEATTSSIFSMRTLVEIFEFVGRAFLSPFFSIFSLIIRIIRVIWMYFSGRGEDVDLTKELIRAGIDAIGLVPGWGHLVGAAGNQIANMYWGSEPFGGIEYLFSPDKPVVESPFTGVVRGGYNTVKGAFNSGKEAIGLSADQPTRGAVDSRPLTSSQAEPQYGF